MNLIQSVILGVVEGITEFLPISSTAHLIIASQVLGIKQTEFQKFFEVFIQSGAILAVVFIYLKYVIKNIKVIKNVIISFIPTAIVGLALHKVIKDVFFESNLLIIAAIGVIGLVFLIVEYLIKKEKIKLSRNIGRINLQTAVIIGLAQALAVVPGVSRAGIVIIAMILMRFRRDEAATYSFLLAVPTILAASALDLYKSAQVVQFVQNDILYVLTGFLASFISAYLAVGWLINFLKKNSLVPFGIYRIALAIILLVLGL